MNFDKVKAVKRLGRQEFKDFTKHGGPHQTKERKTPQTRDFLREYEEDTKDDEGHEDLWQEGTVALDDENSDDDTPYGER